MRVLHVIPSVSSAHGGPSRAMALMERALCPLGVDVEVATTDDDGPRRRLPPASVIAAHAKLSGRQGDTSAYHVFSKQTEFYKISPGLGSWLMRHARNYDVVHIHALFSYSSWAAARAACKAGVPYIVRPLGTLNRYGVERRRPWLKQASLRWVEGPYLRRAAAVHFTAKAEQEEAEILGIPMRSVVLPLAVEAESAPDSAALLTQFPELAGKRIVLFLSRLDPKKNMEALLKAMVAISMEFPDVILAAVGDGSADYVVKLKQLADQQGLAGRVLWTGHLSGTLKASILSAAEVFVLPSFSENFGIAAAEALLNGLPCVLSRGIAIAAQVEAAGAGLAIEPTPDSTVVALRHYLSDGNARAAAGTAAKKLAESHFSLRAMGEGLQGLYQDVICNHRQELSKSLL